MYSKWLQHRENIGTICQILMLLITVATFLGFSANNQSQKTDCTSNTDVVSVQS